MGFLATASAFLMPTFGSLEGEASGNDLQRWEVAYSGHLSLAHKMYLTSKADSVEDELLNLFYLSYACVKAEQYERAIEMFEVVDLIVEERIMKLKQKL